MFCHEYKYYCRWYDDTVLPSFVSLFLTPYVFHDSYVVAAVAAVAAPPVALELPLEVQ